MTQSCARSTGLFCRARIGLYRSSGSARSSAPQGAGGSGKLELHDSLRLIASAQAHVLANWVRLPLAFSSSVIAGTAVDLLLDRRVAPVFRCDRECDSMRCASGIALAILFGLANYFLGTLRGAVNGSDPRQGGGADAGCHPRRSFQTVDKSRTEPPRVSRRLQLLRGWSHDEASSPEHFRSTTRPAYGSLWRLRASLRLQEACWP